VTLHGEITVTMQPAMFFLPSGDGAVYATLAKMRSLAHTGAINPLVRATASSLVRGVPGTASNLQIRIIRDWLSNHVLFLRDPINAEALHTPEWMIRSVLTTGCVQVDCDDVALLAAALGMSIGLRARFVALAFTSPQAPFRHVYTDLSSPTSVQWAELDITRPAQEFAGLAITRRHVERV
jgi:hypothetical protein